MEYDIIKQRDGFIVREKGKEYTVNLRDRLLQFSVKVIRFLMKLPSNKEYDVFRYQLSKSSTSIGANYEEAQSTSAKEFIQKVRIALREANESKYWLTILDELSLGDAQTRKELINEVEEISLILGAIVSKMAKRMKCD